MAVLYFGSFSVFFGIPPPVSQEHYCFVFNCSVYACIWLLFEWGFLGNNFAPFLIGFLSFFVYKNSEKIAFSQLQYVIILAIILFAFFLRKDAIPYIIWCIVLGFIMIYHKTNQNNFVVRFLDNKFVLFLGKISYSIYLVHMVVLVFVLHLRYLLNINGIDAYFFVISVTFLTTIFLSSITYYFVEQPFIKVGKKLSNKFK